jgi:hypothetical protein
VCAPSRCFGGLVHGFGPRRLCPNCWHLKHWDEACHVNGLRSARGPIGLSSLPSACTCILPCDAWRVSNTLPTISLRPDTACKRATLATSSSKSPLSATVASWGRATVTLATNFEHSAAAGVCSGRQLSSSRMRSANAGTDSRNSCPARSYFPHVIETCCGLYKRNVS